MTYYNTPPEHINIRVFGKYWETKQATEIMNQNHFIQNGLQRVVNTQASTVVSVRISH